jgi:hypothetical protein
MLQYADITALADQVARMVADRLAAGCAPGRWLTLKEAMAYAKVRSRDTMMRWIDQGFIYAFRRSGEWIVDRESIDAWFLSERD